ncbi:uncharacterized protein LOC124260191 [Haliotis rubra]|uniref:uncharacterized protein LOC124260191 n=1 Tax=Haliotis rubra TaxID=36100 RepID=UPI001EE500AE|nr:uncharacterized protein LOC124260191 [Haliotis rubra]
MPIKQLVRRLHGDVAFNTINNLSRLKKKYIQSSNRLTFLMRCRDLQIIPNGLRITSPVNSAAAQAILQAASKKLAIERIRHHRKTKSITFGQIEQHLQKLNSTMSPDLFRTLRRAQNQANSKLDTKTKTSQLNKLHKLQEKKQLNPKTSDPSVTQEQFIKKRVINISSKTITKNQINVLAKGLTFISTEPRRHYDDFVSNIEKGPQQLAPGGKIDYLRHHISHILQKAPRQTPNLTQAEKQAVKELKEDTDITMVPANKGRATVILDKSEFHSLVNKMLTDPTTYRKPTSTLQREHKSTLKHLKDTFEITTQQHHKLSVSHPQPPLRPCHHQDP